MSTRDNEIESMYLAALGEARNADRRSNEEGGSDESYIANRMYAAATQIKKALDVLRQDA